MLAKLVSALAFILASSFISLNAHAESEGAASHLLKAYSSQCPAVVTRSVQSSLSHLQSLVSVLGDLKQDSECFGAKEAYEVVSGFEQVYGEYQVYSQTQETKLELEKQVRLFTSLMSDPNLSSSQQSFLQEEILTAQTDLIRAESEFERFHNMTSRYADGANQMISGLEGFLSTWSNNPQCLQDNENLWSSLVSNGLMSVAPFAAPGTALGLATAGVAVHSFSKFIHNYEFNDSIEDLDDAQWPTALRCVSQTLTKQYCEAEETDRLIQAYRRDFSRDDDEGGDLKGIDLLVHHMDQLGHWLKEVYAGSAITSEGDWVNRKKPILQAHLLEEIKLALEAYKATREEEIRRLQDTIQKRDAVASGIQELVWVMFRPMIPPVNPKFISSSGDVENPIFTSRDRKLLPYNLFKNGNFTDIPDCEGSRSNSAKCADFPSFVRDRDLLLDLSDWSRAVDNALKVVEDTLEVVNQERALVIAVDGFSILVRASADYPNQSNALEGLEKVSQNARRIEDYLTKLGCQMRPRFCSRQSDSNEKELRVGNPYYAKVRNVRKTRKLADQVHGLVLEAYNPRNLDPSTLPQKCRESTDGLRIQTLSSEDRKSFKITSCITKLLQLDTRGNDVFFNKVRSMVRYELNARIRHGDFDDDLSDIVSSTRGELVEALVSTYSTSSNRIGLSEVVTGLETSKDMAKGAMKEFGDAFADELEEMIEKVSLSSRQKADFCFRSLAFLSEDNQDLMERVYKMCEGVKMNFYPEGPSLKWNQFVKKIKSKRVHGGRRDGRQNDYHREKFEWTKKASGDLRYCALREYYRDNLLIEQRRQSKSKKEDRREKSKFLDMIL